MFKILIDQISYVLGVANQAKAIALKASEAAQKNLDKAITKLQSYARKLIETAEKQIRDLVHQQLSGVLTVVGNINAILHKLIETVEKNAYRYTTQLVTQLHGIIRKEFDAVTKPLRQDINAVFGLITGLSGQANKAYQWITKEGSYLYAKLHKLADYLNNGKLSILVDLIEKQYPFIVKLSRNPGAFVIDYIEERLLVMLSWLIAKGLGTTDRQLPPKPKY